MLQWLPWEDAVTMAGATTATWAATARSRRSWGHRLRPWAQELTLVLLLYAMWQYAGAWSIGRVGSAVARGRTIWNLERSWHLPDERSVQRAVLHHPDLVHWLNEFYVEVHVPALGACLVWMFVRHRHDYPPVRTVVAIVTGVCLAIQMFPVAPPRLLPHLGVVDTGALIGPNDYSGGAPGIDQFSAMPSMHVAWALIVGGTIVWVSHSRYRWLALLYPALTIVVVVVTGNHYWADAIVAAAICVLAALVVSRVYGRHRQSLPSGEDDDRPTSEVAAVRSVEAAAP
jgi:hypothetical protein